MSDIQDLIYKQSMDCIEIGKKIERERIIKLFETTLNMHSQITRDVIALIKGEGNG